MTRWIAGFFVLLCLAGHTAQAAPPYRIPINQVVNAVLAAHPELAGDAVDLPAPVEAHTTDPVLDVGPVERWSAASATARVRLRCRGAGVCLPFYAGVHLQPTAAPVALPTEGASAHALPPLPAAVRIGQRASLLIDSGMLHLRVSVICLQGGAVGSTIRVTAPDRRTVYQASVLDGTTLRGTL